MVDEFAGGGVDDADVEAFDDQDGAGSGVDSADNASRVAEPIEAQIGRVWRLGCAASNEVRGDQAKASTPVRSAE